MGHIGLQRMSQGNDDGAGVGVGGSVVLLLDRRN